MKDKLHKLHYKCMVVSKQSRDIGKTDLVQMTLIPKNNIKPSDQKTYTWPLNNHIWLRKELTDLEYAGIIPPQFQIVKPSLL